MKTNKSAIRNILVFADWIDMPKQIPGPAPMGILKAEQIRGKEVFHLNIKKSGLILNPLFYSIPTCFYIPAHNSQKRKKAVLGFSPTRLRIAGAGC